jgi:plasmid maintenance system antidote protein VapI
MADDLLLYNLRRNNLKKLIEKYGNQRALGKAINVQESYINHVIKGRRNLSFDYCRKIENTLGIANGWMDLAH